MPKNKQTVEEILITLRNDIADYMWDLDDKEEAVEILKIQYVVYQTIKDLKSKKKPIK